MSCPLVRMTYAIVVQLVVRHLAKVEVAGSSPVCRSLTTEISQWFSFIQFFCKSRLFVMEVKFSIEKSTSSIFWTACFSSFILILLSSLPLFPQVPVPALPAVFCQLLPEPRSSNQMHPSPSGMRLRRGCCPVLPSA